ncbi:TetR/AcrR family transcriptional regulator [Nonomuraea lactucae]|uniref:TetR/AcrR family transcriptional regulator n=1 Tax=Nonomuraea lactucae TaxID=2249762 RepID=UPI001963BFE0|nr:TetR/AcrR family transcriptional regulator [Nonomuraea lactucae]
MDGPISIPRKTPRQQRSQETYDAILEAAAQLFERLGYAGATTNKIAERAGVSIGSLYQYFPNKDALLYALGERHVRHLVGSLKAVFAEVSADDPPLEESVRRLVGALADLHLSEPRTHRLLYDQVPRPAATAVQLRSMQADMAAEVERQLSRLGVGGPDRVVTALLLVQAVEAQVHGAVLDPPPGRSAAEVVEAMVRLCLRMLG